MRIDPLLHLQHEKYRTRVNISRTFLVSCGQRRSSIPTSNKFLKNISSTLNVTLNILIYESLQYSRMGWWSDFNENTDSVYFLLDRASPNYARYTVHYGSEQPRPNPGVSTSTSTCFLTPLTHLLAPHCSPRLHALLPSCVHLLTHSLLSPQLLEKWMIICPNIRLFWTIVGKPMLLECSDVPSVTYSRFHVYIIFPTILQAGGSLQRYGNLFVSYSSYPLLRARHRWLPRSQLFRFHLFPWRRTHQHHLPMPRL